MNRRTSIADLMRMRVALRAANAQALRAHVRRDADAHVAQARAARERDAARRAAAWRAEIAAGPGGN